MSFNPTTDFMALFRMTSGGVRNERMPGLDYAIAALQRAGLITVSVGQTAPTANQASTVWFQPAIPSSSAEGVVFLFNQSVGAYQTATPTLWSQLITAVFPATVIPLVDATPGEVGTSLLYARQDHQHPTDTSRAPLNSPAFTGEPTAPTPTLGDSSTNIATTAFVQETGGVIPPIGSVLAFAGSTAPANWMLAQGQLISRTTFANLFGTAGIGITYGAGDGVTTFGLPDYRGRTVAGVDAGAGRISTATLTSNTLGGTGGTETHALTTGELATHNHAVTDPGHTHPVPIPVGDVANVSATIVTGGTTPVGINITVTSTSATTGISTQNNGSGTAHLNVQPTIVQQWIIRVS